MRVTETTISGRASRLLLLGVLVVAVVAPLVIRATVDRSPVSDATSHQDLPAAQSTASEAPPRPAFTLPSDLPTARKLRRVLPSGNNQVRVSGEGWQDGENGDMGPGMPYCVNEELNDYAIGPYVSRNYSDQDDASMLLQIYHVPLSKTSAVRVLIDGLPTKCRSDQPAKFVQIQTTYGDASTAYRGYTPGEDQLADLPGRVSFLGLSGNWVVYAESEDYYSAKFMDDSLAMLLRQLDEKLSTNFARSTSSASLAFPEKSYLAAIGWRAQNPTYRPRDVGLSGDSSFFLEDMDWSQWSAEGAVGRGISHENTCTPGCADGNYLDYPVKITLSQVKPSCGLPFYTKFVMEYLVDVPEDGKRRFTWIDGELPACGTP